MKCSKCGYENNGGKFCEECGAPLGDASFEKTANAEENSAGLTESSMSGPARGGVDDDFLKSLGELAEAANEADTDISEEIPASRNYGENGGENSSDSQQNAENDETAEEYGNYSEENYYGGDKKDSVTSDALENLKKYEEGTIPHPEEKSQKKQKKKFYCPQNPMLWSFLWLLLFGAVLGALTAFFFNVDLDGTQIIFGVVFSVFTAAVLCIDFIYYFPAALTLDNLLKGKGARLEYKLKKHELVDLAEKAKKKNRGFYLAISLFGLAFSIYYIYILANAMVKTNLMWISLYFSIGVFVIFALLFFIMPKFNYEKMMQNGERVIVGNKSVYYGGTYYHWSKIIPEATFGNLNTKKHKLEIIFVQEQKDGSSKRRKVEMYAPDSALKEVTRLLEEYEETSKKYREKQQRNTVTSDDEKKRGKDKK